METNNSELLTYVKEISLASDESEFFDITTKFVFLFQDNKSNDPKIRDEDIYGIVTQQIVTAVFSNNIFTQAVLLILRQHKVNSKQFYEKYQSQQTEIRPSSPRIEFEETQRDVNVSQKSLIQISLYLTILPLVILRKQLSTESFKAYAKHLNWHINSFVINHNNEFSKTEMLEILNQIVYDSKYHYRKIFLPMFEGKLDAELLFSSLSISRNLVGSVLVLSAQNERIAKTFKRVTKLLEKNSLNFRLENVFNELSKPLKFVEYTITDYRRDYKLKYEDDLFDNFIMISTHKLDANVRYVLSKIILFFAEPNKLSFRDKAFNFLNASSDIKNEIEHEFKTNFSVFKKQNLNDSDWSNKLYIITIKTLSILSSISDAKNNQWKFSVFINEMSLWVNEVNQIINKYSLEDDYDEIKRFLVSENENIEWKSSFQMALQQEFVSDIEERKLASSILTTVIKPILAMLNTNGGTVLVGVVEKPEKIIRKSVLQNLITKNGTTFYDISHEMKVKKEDLDSLKRKVQEQLMNLTNSTADKFNKLIEFKELEIKSNERSVTVVKISIQKSAKLFYAQDTVTKKYYLLKRADGRTVEVDLREYLNFTNTSWHKLYVMIS